MKECTQCCIMPDPPVMYGARIDIVAQRRGPQVTVTMQKDEGWTYIVSTESGPAVSSLRELFPQIPTVVHVAEMQRHTTEDGEAGTASEVVQITVDTFRRLLALKGDEIPGLVFPAPLVAEG